MHDLFGSVRKSLNFRADGGGGGGGISDRIKGKIDEKIGSYIRKSMMGINSIGFPHKLPPPPPPQSTAARWRKAETRPESTAEEEEEAAVAPAIRWRMGELIGSGAFGQVYIGMNLDSGSLLAIKQVLIPTKKAQEQLEELEKEVKLLKNLSHPNIVRYLGTTREEDAINILLEFVPGGSISSLLGKFGSFPEAVIRTYTKQLLQGLEYLHQNGIIHRDIKGANILVDNKGCIKLADFGASKKVRVLATMAAAKSMKGTPCYMAPEVICSEGHTFSADIWSVGCTVIEMATGKPPWSQQFQEQEVAVAFLFRIGNTKAHPPVPEHLSSEAKDFLSKCFQKEPSARPTASNLLRHPFVTGDNQDRHPLHRPIAMELDKSMLPSSESCTTNINDSETRSMASCAGLNGVNRDSNSTMFTGDVLKVKPLWEMDSSDDMCQFYDKEDFPVLGSSCNPVVEPISELPCKFEPGIAETVNGTKVVGNQESDFTFPCEAIVEDDDEVTESKIRAFLDEKALDLKKLQTPLYEFFNSLNSSSLPFMVEKRDELAGSNMKLPLKSKASPTNGASGRLDQNVEATNSMSRRSCSIRQSHCNMDIDKNLREIPSPKINEWEGIQEAREGKSLRMNVSKKHKKWREELDQELAREREMRHGGRLSPRDGATNRFSRRFIARDH